MNPSDPLTGVAVEDLRGVWTIVRWRDIGRELVRARGGIRYALGPGQWPGLVADVAGGLVRCVRERSTWPLKAEAYLWVATIRAHATAAERDALRTDNESGAT